MKTIDLLLITNEEQYAKVSNSFLDDMALNELTDILTKEEFAFFVKIINTPLINIENILDRQKIFNDFMKNPLLISEITTICYKAQKYKFPIYDRVYSTIDPQRKLLDYLRIINKTLKVPLELDSLFRHLTFDSRQLTNLKNELLDTEKIIDLSSEINSIASCLLTKNISIQIKYEDHRCLL